MDIKYVVHAVNNIQNNIITVANVILHLVIKKNIVVNVKQHMIVMTRTAAIVA
jgi:hypothetical protein